jgi:hypothetical protein
MQGHSFTPHSLASSPPGIKSGPSPEPKSSLRRFAFYLVIGMTFIRCSMLHELLKYELHFDTYLLYVISILTILVVVVSGSIQRPFHFRPSYYWFGYALWMTIAILFSIWRGGSLNVVIDYWRTNLVMLFVLGAVISTWEECKVLLRTLALSGVAVLFIIREFSQLDVNGRMSLKFGTFANSNDYPGHLLVLLPSLLWVAFVTRSVLARIAALGAFGYGLYVILAGSSRGALIALAIGIVFYLFSASMKERIAALAFAIIIVAIVFSLLPEHSIHRLFSFSETSSPPSSEAAMSSAIRSRLLQDSIWYALKNPVFGLGPGTFSEAEGGTQHGLWYETHNSYTEAASECGLPALFFFLGGIGSSYALFRRIGRELGEDVRAKEFVQAAFCMRLTVVLFCSVITFLNFAYSFHLPMIAGVSIAMGYARENWKPAMQPVEDRV